MNTPTLSHDMVIAWQLQEAVDPHATIEVQLQQLQRTVLDRASRTTDCSEAILPAAVIAVIQLISRDAHDLEANALASLAFFKELRVQIGASPK